MRYPAGTHKFRSGHFRRDRLYAHPVENLISEISEFLLLSMIKMGGFMGIATISKYLDLYKYLPVLDEEQIRKLRKIAIGILDLSAFSTEEIHVLETKLLVSDNRR
jgi:hypothetical protein